MLMAVARVGLDVMRPKSSLVMPKLTTVPTITGLIADVKGTDTELGRSLLGRFCRVMAEGSRVSISTASVNVSCSKALLRSREKLASVGKKVSGTRVVEGSSEMGDMTLSKLSVTELAATLRKSVVMSIVGLRVNLMPFKSASEISTVMIVPGETLMTVEVARVNWSPLPSAFLYSVKPVMSNDITSMTSSNVRSSTPKSMLRANSRRVGGVSSLMTSVAWMALPSVMASLSFPKKSSTRLLSMVM